MIIVEIYPVDPNDVLKTLRNRLLARTKVWEIDQWLKDNDIEAYFGNSSYRYIEFTNPEDAVAFRLRFGL